MAKFVLESYSLLLWVEVMMVLRNLGAICGLVRTNQLPRKPSHRGPSCSQLCQAINLACVLYPKRVLCLQRSAATTVLLRRHGIAAEMVIGARVLPFRSHSWVEVDRVVVNDKPYMAEIYSPIERV
jgi:hypothetical protein